MGRGRGLGRAAVVAAVAASILGCGWVKGLAGPPIPAELVDEVAPELSALGHPQADFVEADVVGWSAGDPAAHERWVDVRIRYQRPARDAQNAMVVRLYQERLEPCRISLDVLEDDGPEPVLLDNGIASAAIGARLCDALAAAQGGG